MDTTEEHILARFRYEEHAEQFADNDPELKCRNTSEGWEVFRETPIRIPSRFEPGDAEANATIQEYAGELLSDIRDIPGDCLQDAQRVRGAVLKFFHQYWQACMDPDSGVNDDTIVRNAVYTFGYRVGKASELTDKEVDERWQTASRAAKEGLELRL